MGIFAFLRNLRRLACSNYLNYFSLTLINLISLARRYEREAETTTRNKKPQRSELAAFQRLMKLYGLLKVCLPTLFIWIENPKILACGFTPGALNLHY